MEEEIIEEEIEEEEPVEPIIDETGTTTGGGTVSGGTGGINIPDEETEEVVEPDPEPVIEEPNEADGGGTVYASSGVYSSTDDFYEYEEEEEIVEDPDEDVVDENGAISGYGGSVWSGSQNVSIVGVTPKTKVAAVDNPTEFAAKPLVMVVSSGGLVEINDAQITFASASYPIFVDCDAQYAYYIGTSGGKVVCNEKITLGDNKFWELSPGENDIAVSSGIKQLAIVEPRFWRL